MRRVLHDRWGERCHCYSGASSINHTSSLCVEERLAGVEQGPLDVDAMGAGLWDRAVSCWYIVTEVARAIRLLMCHHAHKQQPPVPPDITLTSGPSFIELVSFQHFFLIIVSQENLLTWHSIAHSSALVTLHLPFSFPSCPLPCFVFWEAELYKVCNPGFCAF